MTDVKWHPRHKLAARGIEIGPIGYCDPLIQKVFDNEVARIKSNHKGGWPKGKKRGKSKNLLLGQSQTST